MKSRLSDFDKNPLANAMVYMTTDPQGMYLLLIPGVAGHTYFFRV